MDNTLEERNSIDFAIAQCHASINRHSRKSIFFLMLMFMWPLLWGLYFIYNNLSDNAIVELILNLIKEAKNSWSTIEGLTSVYSGNSGNRDYLIFVLVIVIFGFFASFYRFHLKEIAKYEHSLLWFMRIRIAANNSEQKFDTEVRKSLTEDAFSYDTKDHFFKRWKWVENPLPGHIWLDLSSAIVNKIIEWVEIMPRKDTK